MRQLWQRRKKVIQYQTLTAKAVQVGETTVTLQSQALSIRLPFGGFVWHRPTAVFVQQGEQVERIPVVDVTRLTLWALAGLSLAITIASLLAGRKN